MAVLARRAAAASSRHTAFVYKAKAGLIFASTALIAALIAVTQSDGDKNYIRLIDMVTNDETSDVLSMTNARFHGVDDNNQPYNVTAQTARQQRFDSPTIELEGLTADVKHGIDNVVISSQGAQIDRATHNVDLTGNVAVKHDGGYTLNSDHFRVDTREGTAISTAPVQGMTPTGLVDAAGMEISDFGQRVLFKGKSQVTIAPDSVTPTLPLRQDVPLR